MNKFAQKTRFDEMMESVREPRERGEQPALPFYDPEWQERSKKDFHTWKYRGKPSEQVEFEQELNRPKPKPRQSLQFNYPELSPEQLQYRPLNEREERMLQHKEQEARNRREEYYPYGNSDYWREQRAKEYENTMGDLQKLRDLQKALPDDIKKEVLAKYGEFRKVAAEFYAKYKEANELASGAAELSYDGTYRDLVRDFSKFTVELLKIKMGTLFGHIRDRKGRGSTTAQYLSEFFRRGLNIFTINALNYEHKLHEMDNAINMMRAIIDEYDKMKKVLVKLPERVRHSVNSFLRKKENKEFLDWMQEHFPGEDDKEKFVKNSIRDLVAEAESRDLELHLGDLKVMRSYKNIHDKASHTSTELLFENVHKGVSNEIVESVKEQVAGTVLNKCRFILELLTNGDKEYKTEEELGENVNFVELSRYLKKEFQIDLPSIFNFVNNVMDNYWSRNFPEEEVEMIATQKLKAQGSKQQFYGMFLHALKSNIEKLLKDRWSINNAIGDHVIELLRNWRDTIPLFKIKDLAKYDEKDLHNVVSNVMKELVITSLPNFDNSRRHHYGPREPKFPDFRPLGDLVKKTGRFSIGDFTNFVAKEVPSIPKEFWFHLVRNLVKNSSEYGGDLKHFENLGYMTGTSQKTTLEALTILLKRFSKFNPDVFTNMFKKHFDQLQKATGNLGVEFKGIPDSEQAKIIADSIRNFDTVEQDSENLIEFLKFKHNEASKLNQKDMLKILQNKNFFAFNKSGIARKLVKIYAAIKSRGGVKAIFDKYASILPELIQRKFISKNFRKNMLFVLRFFDSGELINPKSESFPQMFQIISSLETDLATIEMGDALKELMEQYEEKNPKLYDLNTQINDRLRFRVLEGKDPRTLSVGVETNCCQRIGGMAESAAKDSFINPLAGVLLLEWKNEEGHWVLVAQSYFHYVPRDGGFILDNVETNSSNKYKSEIDLEAAYAYLAQKIKAKDPYVSYFLAGKGYSKIDSSDFKSHRLRQDPRSFSAGSTKGSGKSSVYSDFDNRNSIDLLAPKGKDMVGRIAAVPSEGETKKSAMNMDLRKHIFKTMLAA